MEKLYTCAEIAQKYRVTIRTVYDWIKKDQLDAIKIGKSFRVKESALDAFEKRKVK